MKKIMIITLILILFITVCDYLKSEPELDEFQITACEAADKAGTCNTRLMDVSIVLPEECCNVLGRCCE